MVKQSAGIKEVPGERFVVSHQDVSLPGFVLLGRRHSSKANTPLKKHRHPGVLEICFLASGRQNISMDQGVFDLRGNDLLITPPGAVHHSSTHPLEKCTLYYLQLAIDPKKPPGAFLGFDKKDIPTVLAKLVSPPKLHFRGEPDLKKILNKAIDAYKKKDLPFKPSVISQQLTCFILRVLELLDKSGGIRVPAALEHAMTYIHQNLDNSVNSSDLSKAASLSSAGLKRLFQRHVGFPPKEYILRKKIDRAKEQLLAGRKSVTGIAVDLGFSSSQHFATLFKRYTGQTPVGFQKNRFP